MDSNSWKDIDNSKPIPEPILTNVENAARQYTIDLADQTRDDEDTFIEGAQYGYNIAQVFVNDLKALIKEYEDRFGIKGVENTK